jgi:hypothetical protein
MHLDNQSCELVGPDLVVPHVADDDARDQIGIDPTAVDSAGLLRRRRRRWRKWRSDNGKDGVS